MKKLNVLLFMAALVSLTSCLKTGPVNLAPGASPMVVEWSTATLDDAPQNSTTATYRLYKRAYPIVASVTMPLQIDITGTDAAASDITVGLTIGDANAYAAFIAPALTAPATPLLPTTVYTAPTSVTIPKGLRTATVNVVLNTQLFDPSKVYYLPVTITSTTSGGISGNYGTVVYQVQAKNQYDGQYNVTGTMTDYVAGSGITGKYPVKYYLETTGLTTNVLFDYVYAGTFGHEILSAGATSYFGNFSPIFTFDANNNITSVVNYYGQGTNSSTRSAAIDPTGVNKFTSGTPGVAGSVFQVSYFLYQTSASPAGTGPGGSRDQFTETYTYLGPRP